MAYTETEQRNLDTCTRMYEEMLFKFDADLIDTYIPADYIQHSTAATEGREGLRAFFQNRGDRFPDISFRIVRKFADGDYTVFHIHTVREPGDPGLSIIDYFRMEDGMVKEHWEVLQEIPAELPHGNGVF